MKTDYPTAEIVLVTGASSGIGWATSLAYAERGAKLALAARREDKLRELARLVREKGGEPLEIVCDVRDPAQARKAVEAAVARWGRVDILINNAGILEVKKFAEQKLETIEDIIRTNVLGCANVLHAVLPHMLRQKKGHVVNVASIAGLMGLPEMAAYCASKFALVGLTESLRRELAGTGVTLTSFCPGTVDTPMAARGLADRPRPMKPKSADAVAKKILRAVDRRLPEVVYGEVLGPVVHLARFFPRTTDAMVHKTFERYAAKPPARS